jgi:hypothetical protein
MAVETSIQIRESCYRCQKILAQEGESLRDIDGRIAETVTKLMLELVPQSVNTTQEFIYFQV